MFKNKINFQSIPFLKNNASIDINNGKKILIIQQNKPIQNFFRFLKFKVPKVQKIELDETSFKIINLINNKNSLEKIFNIVKDKKQNQENEAIRFEIFINKIYHDFKIIKFK